MCLFNRKKIKELQEKLEYEQKLVQVLEERNKDLEKRAGEHYKSLSLQKEETRKAYDWIQKILETFGTVETRNKMYKIPIYKEELKPYVEGMGYPLIETERIVIPTIVISKMEDRSF